MGTQRKRASVRVIRIGGLTPYAEAHALQRRLVDRRADGLVDDVLLLLEHAEVITIGRRRGAEQHVHDAAGIGVIEVERGGDVTWHGPGQLVAYPLVQLDPGRVDLPGHLRALEDAIMAVLRPLGLEPCRDPRNTGVWLPSPAGPLKVCSMGIACRRWVTWHGLALNVAPELASFRRIAPCGMAPDVMTRLADHLDPCPSLEDLVAPLAEALADALREPWDGTCTRVQDCSAAASLLGTGLRAAM